MSRNTQHIEGYLAQDPDLRFTPSGTAVAEFSIADNNDKFDNETKTWVHNQRKIGGTNDFEDDVTWFKVVAFGDLATSIAESLKKGDPVIVDGTTRQDVSIMDGNRTTWNKVVANTVSIDLRYAKVGNVEKHRRSGASSSSGTSGRYRQQPQRATAPQKESHAPAFEDEPPF